MQRKQSINNQFGFTLVELAIALLIIGIVAGGFVTSITKNLETSRVDNTKLELDVIKQNLFGFAYTNTRLPCPDCTLGGAACPGGTEKDGGEDINGMVCSVGNGTGNIPWRTLGLGGGDAWATHYRYWVHAAYADTGGFTLAAPVPNGLVNERDAADAVVTLSNNLVAVIFSHGANRYGGVSVSGDIDLALPPAANIDELENINNDQLFFSRIKTGEDAATVGGEFDDIFVWISEMEMKAVMVKAGVLP